MFGQETPSTSLSHLCFLQYVGQRRPKKHSPATSTAAQNGTVQMLALGITCVFMHVCWVRGVETENWKAAHEGMEAGGSESGWGE